MHQFQGSITKQTRLLLANALYFKGIWVHAFNQSDTYLERFFMSNGQSVVARMMHGSGTFQAGVFDDLGAKAILLPYQVFIYFFFNFWIDSQR